MKLKRIIWLLMCLLMTGSLYAQVRVVTGRVLDDKMVSVPGATVAEVGNLKNATATDENGNFKITLKNDNVSLSVTAIGYVAATIPVGGQRTLTLTIKNDTKGLEEVVVVGFSRQKRITNTGAVSSIKGEEIATVPTSSIQNALVGRLPGFFSTQRSGQPGGDAADFYIRGVNSLGNADNTPLIIVDDIEYTYAQVSQLSVNEIESVSILKDAATTAIYGVKGANGVMVVTTRRGKVGKPKINLSTEFGVNAVIEKSNYLDSYTTALLMNEAFTNDSYGLTTPLTLPWTAADLQKFKDGSDPYGHPNVNWQDVLFNNSSSQKRYDVNISGGNNVVKYFTSLGYFTQDGILKEFAPTKAGDDLNTNYFYNRVNFRSNLDITPTKTLKLNFDLNGRFETQNSPFGNQDAAGFFKEISEYRALAPFAMPLVNPNGSYGYASQVGGNGFLNPVTRIANSGYTRNYNNNFNIIIGANQLLDFITQGLSAKINVSYASNINEKRNVFRTPTTIPTYLYNSTTNTYIVKPGGPTQLLPYTQTPTNTAFNNTTIIQASLGYDRTLGANHFYGLFLLNQNSYQNLANQPLNYRGTTGRIGYDYKRKYLIEFNIARNGNDLFRADQRYGIFPAVSAGWNLSEERFFKKLFPFIDLFKIKGSYGLVGSDKTYPSTVFDQIQYTTSSTISLYGSGISEGALVNPYVTWEKSRKTDIGTDINMLNGKIEISGDYFYEYRYDQLIAQGDVPLVIGQTLPAKNIGISANRGFEASFTYKSKIGQVNYSIGGNISHYKNKIIYTSEAPDYPYLAATGRQIGLSKGYKSLGFFQQSDFDANGQLKAGIPRTLGGIIEPGDLKYADLNGDGVITPADQTYLSLPNIPTSTYGVNLGFGYKGFSFRTLLQGAFGYAIQLNGEATDAFNGNLRPLYLDRWTPATATTATYPRLSFAVSTNNSALSTPSDFWFQNASYIRLKSIELGYNFPAAWLKKSFVNSARIYLSGYNLATIRNTGKFQVDPEVANGQNGGYPLTANYSLGFQLGF